MPTVVISINNSGTVLTTELIVVKQNEKIALTFAGQIVLLAECKE